jgi:hypothetical protein
MDLTIEELHKFDDMSLKQRQLATVKSADSKSSKENAPIDAEKHLFGKDGFTFDDFLDIINPLQHIPVISTLYRELSGDQIAHMPRIFGGALFGGPIGAGAAVVNAALHQETGKDIGEHIVALFNEDTPSTLVAKQAETDLVAAAGSNKTSSIESLALQNVQAQTIDRAANLAIVKPTLAELNILQTETRSKQSAQISFLDFPKNQKSASALSLDKPFSQDKAISVARPAAPEEQILALEKAVEQFQQKRRTPQRAPVATIAPAKINAVAQILAHENGAIKSQASSVKDVTASANSPWISFQPTNSKVSANTSAIPSVNTATNSGANKAAAMAAASAAITPGKPPLGALANKGGWFSDVMVTALTKYEQSKQLKQPTPAQAINQLN